MMERPNKFRDRYILARRIAGVAVDDIADEAGVSAGRIRQVIVNESSRYRQRNRKLVPVLDDAYKEEREQERHQSLVEWEAELSQERVERMAEQEDNLRQLADLIGQKRVEKMAELSQAFYPGTIEGIAQRYWDLGAELHALEQERTNLGALLTRHIESTGEVVMVEGLPALRLVGTFRWRGGTAVEEHRLRFDRPERKRR